MTSVSLNTLKSGRRYVLRNDHFGAKKSLHVRSSHESQQQLRLSLGHSVGSSCSLVCSTWLRYKMLLNPAHRYVRIDLIGHLMLLAVTFGQK